MFKGELEMKEPDFLPRMGQGEKFSKGHPESPVWVPF